MARQLLFVLTVSIFIVLLIPNFAHAEASVVQDSCVTVGDGPPWDVWTYFTIVNFSLPSPVCALLVIPEPQPVDPGCEMIDLRQPAGWTGFFNSFGGADWFANTPTDCIPAGTAKGEFAFLLDPDFCCYIVQFLDPTGAVMLEQEECFTCQKVPTEDKTWGHIKELYK
jgi:hypothetical protein